MVRSPRPLSQRGQTTGEYVGIIALLVAVVVAVALVRPQGIASSIASAVRQAICTIADGACGGGADGGSELASGEPAFACEQHRATRGVNLNLGLVVGLDRNLDYDLAVFSDGEAHLFYRHDAEVAAGVGGGLQADLYWGEGGLTLGGQASASAGLRFGEGETFVWSGPDAERHARDYRTIHAAGDAPGDLVLTGRNSLPGRIWHGVVRGGNWVLNRLPLVNGVEVREPERRLEHRAGGVELEASLSGGWIVDEGPVDARIEGALKRAAGYTLDTETGDKTVYVVADTGIETEGRLGTMPGTDDAAWDATWSNESIVAVTLGPDDELIEATVTTYRVDEAGRAIAGTTGLRAAFPDRRFGTGTRDGGRDALATPSLYQVETRLDLTDPANEDLIGRVVAGQALTGLPDIATDYAAEFALRRVHEAGQTTIVEYDTSDRRYGADVEAAAIAEGSAGASYAASDRSVAEAYYYDDVLGRYALWLSCTG